MYLLCMGAHMLGKHAIIADTSAYVAELDVLKNLYKCYYIYLYM